MKKLLPLLFLFFIQSVNAELNCSTTQQQCNDWFARTVFASNPGTSVALIVDSTGYHYCTVTNSSNQTVAQLSAGFCTCINQDGQTIPYDENSPDCQPADDGGSQCDDTDSTFEYSFHVPYAHTKAGGNSGGFDIGNIVPLNLCPQMNGCAMIASGASSTSQKGFSDLTGSGNYKQTGSKCDTPSPQMEYATEDRQLTIVVDPNNPLNA